MAEAAGHPEHRRPRSGRGARGAAEPGLQARRVSAETGRQSLRRFREVPLDEADFEGTLVLEDLVAKGLLDAFLEAVDADDFERALLLMKEAQIDPDTISIVMKKMANSDGDH